jgi:hypothetical protein
MNQSPDSHAQLRCWRLRRNKWSERIATRAKTARIAGLAILTVAMVADVAAAGTLRKVWEFQTDVIPGAGTPGAPLGIFALGFSRDGKQIGAVVGQSNWQESILVADSQAPNTQFVKVDVRPQLWMGNRIEWSLSGRQVIWGRRIVQVPSGADCLLPDTAGAYRFSGSAQVVGVQLKAAGFAFFDLDCHSTGVLEMPGQQSVGAWDVSAERGLLFVTLNTISHYTVTEVSRVVIDVNSKKAVRQLPTWRRSTESSVMPLIFVNPTFADWGKAFCWMRGSEWHRVVGCSTVDQGQTLAATKGWNDPDVRTAIGSLRAVISDYVKKLDLIDLFWYRGSLRKRVVWDFQSRKEILHWKPKTQKVVIQASSAVAPTLPQTTPYQFEISPDGEYILEGGAGVVSLYRIVP